MLNLLLIIISLLSGVLVRMGGLTSANAHKGLNVWILNIALPAIFFRYIPYLNWDAKLLMPLIAPVVVWFAGIIIFNIIGSKWRTRPVTLGALKLTAGLSNTSFLGFIAVYYSVQDIGIAIVYDQVSFILLATVGLVTASRSSRSKSPGIKYIVHKLLLFPPFIACAIALIVPHFTDISFFNPLFDRIGSTIGPLALFTMGMQLQLRGWKKYFKYLFTGLGYKHLLAPAIITGICLLLGQKGIIAKITIFQAAMPSLAAAGVLANDRGLDAQFSNLLVGTSILLSFISTAFWWWVLQWLM